MDTMREPKRIQGDLTLIREYKALVVQYANATDIVAEFIKMVHGRPDVLERVRAQHKNAVDVQFAARSGMVKRMREVTELAQMHSVGYTFTIQPPPAIGGYISEHNVFEAFLEDELLYGFTVKPTEVLDALDHIQANVEREARESAEYYSGAWSRLKRMAGGAALVFRWMFESERDRAIVKWLFIRNVDSIVASVRVRSAP